jgi:tRNA(adenine34) deaminase
VTDVFWWAAFEQAWAAFGEGSLPIGAVVADGAGVLVGRGRNRQAGPAVPGQLGGTRIAHAEVNALAALPPGDFPDHVLYTTLEPCFLCTMALRMSHVPTVRYAATDNLWYGVEQFPAINHNLARRWPSREPAADGPWREVSTLLMMLYSLGRNPSVVIDDYAGAGPGLLDRARGLAGAPAARLRLRPLEEAWPELVG